MKPNVAEFLDPSEFTVVPHVAIVDEFRMTNDDGTFVAEINEAFLTKMVARMREREATTGDLCPGVIGHTPDGEFAEVDGPPVTAYLRNWVLDDFFDTGRKAAFADVWVYNDDVPLVRKFPRRSAEIWPDRYEADPLSFLGATTPARDLGLMKLSRSGSITYSIPGDMQMPDPKMPVADPKEAADAKGSDAKLDQVLAALTKLTDMIAPLVAPPAAGADAGGAPAPGGSGQGGDEMSDEEFLKSLEGQQVPPEKEGGPVDDDKESRKDAEPPVKNYGAPGGNDTAVAGLKMKLARIEIERAAEKAQMAGKDVSFDEDFVTDLISMPEDIRNRQIDRVIKNARPLPTKQSASLDAALGSAVGDGKKRPRTVEESQAVQKLARQKGILYEDAAAELGYTLR